MNTDVLALSSGRARRTSSSTNRHTSRSATTIHSKQRASKYQLSARRLPTLAGLRSSRRGTSPTEPEAEPPPSRSTFSQRMVDSDRLAAHWTDSVTIVPRIGTLRSSRPEGTWRFMYCQMNGLATASRRWEKIEQLSHLVQEFDVNGVVMCETGVNWDTYPRGNPFKGWLDNNFEREIYTNTAHNKHGPTISHGQQGGTAMILTNEILQYARNRDNDPTGLGRWCSWCLYMTPSHRTRIIVAYCPGKKGKRVGLKTVTHQHMIYIDEHNIPVRSPYEMFLRDLSAQLREWKSAGDRLLLFMDNNEHILTGRITRRLQQDDIDIREISHTFWPPGECPHTFEFGSLPIDAIYATPDLEISNFLALSFHESVGDHRTMLVDITMTSAIGKTQGKIIRPVTRRLTTKQAVCVSKYNKLVEEAFEYHQIAERLTTLDNITKTEGFPASPDTKQRILAIHKQIDEIRVHAEKRCRKIYRPNLVYSPPVRRLNDKIHALQTIIKVREGVKTGMNIGRAYRTARRHYIDQPHTLTITECKVGIALAKQRLKKLQTRQHCLRRDFLRNQLRKAKDNKDDERAKDIQRRLRMEYCRNTWRTINRVTRPNNSRAVLEVQEQTSNGIITHTNQQTVEAAIQRECESRFHLGHSAPISNTLLGEQLKYLHNPTIAFEIISGSFKIPSDLDSATKLLLVEIGKLGRLVLQGNITHEFEITASDYVQYWRRIKESTSSSPSGLHHGHYKASCKSEIIPEIMATQMNVTIRSGVHPLRWGTALQVLLEKVAGIRLVDKLRSIQLYEADLNWYMKFIFNDKAMEALTSSNMCPEEHYSQKESMAEDACLDKTLTMDISRQARHPMAILSLDAAQCYDRVQPVMMSLVWLALLNHIPVISILLTVLQGMKIHTRTGFGDSATFFGGDPEHPFCGLGQGSKAAPASWLQLSSMIINAFKSEGFGARMIDPVTLALTLTIGCLYVDDTDIYVWDDTLTSAISVWKRAQDAVSLWSRLLMATGGAIKGQKSFWYLLDYKQERGEWKLVHNNTLPLYVPSPSGDPYRLLPKAPTEAERTLGVFHSPVGGNAMHLNTLVDRIELWIRDIKNGHLSTTQAWLAYLRQLLPGIKYALGTLGNNYKTADDLFRKLEFQLLPLLGVNRHIKKGWRRLPPAFGGVGLFSLPIEQIICRCNLFLQHYRTTSSLGKKIDMTLHWLQLQLGTHHCPLRLDYEQWKHLATDSWIKALWESLSLFPIDLEIRFDEIPLPRRFDDTIMNTLLPYTSSVTELRAINRCRCFLHLMFLSDISLADGTTADYELIEGTRIPRASRMKFPREEPSVDDWKVWASAWSLALLPRRRFHTALGDWAHASHIQWTWFLDPIEDRIFEVTSDTNHTVYTPTIHRRRTRHNVTYSPTTIARSLPTSVFPISIQRTLSFDRKQAIKIEGGVGTKHAEPALPISDFWELLRSWGGNWMWSNVHFDSRDTDLGWLRDAISNGTSIWVTDGSYDEHRGPRFSGAGWVVKDTATNRYLACSFAEWSLLAGSYRAEVLGLCSIHVFILALQQAFRLTTNTPITISCDNLRALNKASCLPRRIPANAKCPDLLRSLRNIKRQITLPTMYKHVKAHMDDILSWSELTLPQQLNVQCDLLAKSAVRRAISNAAEGQIILTQPLLPQEFAAVHIMGHKITSDPTLELHFYIGQHLARKFYVDEQKWSEQKFDEVCWDSLRRCIETKSVYFRLWLTKQSSNFIASRKQIARIMDSDDDKCPSCTIHREDAAHLCICPNEDRTMLLKECVDELSKWLQTDGFTDPELAYWIPKYILCRGTVSFSDMGNLGPMSSSLRILAASQDIIGWREFMEGKISHQFYRIQEVHLIGTHTNMTASLWTKTFISKVLHITHSQWIFRNFMLHDHLNGYLQRSRQAEITMEIDQLLQTHVDEIPTDRAFLLELDIEDISTMDFEAQNYWVFAMNAAISAQSNIVRSQLPPRPPGSRSQQPRQLSRPWESSWGIHNVIQQIRREAAEIQGNASHWWIGPIRRDHPAEVSRREIRSVAGRTVLNNSNRRRKPD